MDKLRTGVHEGRNHTGSRRLPGHFQDHPGLGTPDFHVTGWG
ncbi:hypothetical protein UO65_6094 [Actinokineospora spheciospongiae]|uniref:Uncharacterized protein n=1 Tax=Actinokineospora spheciospongiae TaxID=909613 RepID=W7IPH8_9PSEU|nr:hypothetical protein UO65_6094 [Actinokineospora spheciospongiae]